MALSTDVLLFVDCDPTVAPVLADDIPVAVAMMLDELTGAELVDWLTL